MCFFLLLLFVFIISMRHDRFLKMNMNESIEILLVKQDHIDLILFSID